VTIVSVPLIYTCVRTLVQTFMRARVHRLSLASGDRVMVVSVECCELWAVSREALKRDFKGHMGPVVHLNWLSDNRLLSGSRTLHHILLYLFVRPPQCLQHHAPAFRSFSHYSAGKKKNMFVLMYLLFVWLFPTSRRSVDLTLRVWDPTDFSCTAVVQEPKSEMSCFCYLPPSQQVL
jgi:hypothetical protein